MLGELGLACFLRQSEDNERGPWVGVVQAVYMTLPNLSVLSRVWWTTRPSCWPPAGCQQPLLGARPRDAKKSPERAKCQERAGLSSTRAVMDTQALDLGGGQRERTGQWDKG